MERKPIGKSVRFKIFDRDGFTCVYCGRTPPAVILHLDHVVPVVDGGEDTDDNLVTSCRDCNLGKGSRPLGAAPPIDYRAQGELVKERAEQMAAYHDYLRDLADQRETLIDLVGEEFFNTGRGATFSREGRGPAFRAQVGQFIDRAGLEAVLEAARISAAAEAAGHIRKGQWQYFAGICWKRIRGEQ